METDSFLSNFFFRLFFNNHPKSFVTGPNVESLFLLKQIFVHNPFHINFKALFAFVIASGNEIEVVSLSKAKNTLNILLPHFMDVLAFIGNG